MQMQREKALENTQNGIVSDLADRVASIGQLSDYAEEQNQTNKSLTDKHRLTCQKILALSFKRCHHMAQQYFFERWRQATVDFQRSQATLKNAILHCQKGDLAFAFAKWVQNASVEVRQRQLLTQSHYEARVIKSLKGTKEANQN